MRQDDRPLLTAHPHDHLEADLLQLDVALLGERERHPQGGRPVRRLELLGEVLVHQGLRIAVCEHGVRQPIEHRGADHLLLEEGGRQDGHRREGGAHQLHLLLLVDAPALEVAAVDLLGKDPVDDDRVGEIAVQVQVGVGPHRLPDDHAVGVHHEADRGGPAVAEDRVHGDQVDHEALHVVEHPVGGQGHVEQGAREGARRRHQAALDREDLLEPPARDIRERQESQGLAGGRAVHDDRVVVAGLVVTLDLEEREQLVHPGRDRQLVGRDPVHAALGEHLAHPVLNRLPVALHLLLGLDLLAPEVVPAGRRRASELRLERVGEAVGRVRGQNHGPQAGRRAAARGRGRDAGLAHAPLARVQDRPRRHGRHRIRVAATRPFGSSGSP